MTETEQYQWLLYLNFFTPEMEELVEELYERMEE